MYQNLATVADTDISFLPRIEAVFYAVFDLNQGPKIVCQVPEGLIATSTSSSESTRPQNDATQLPPSPSVGPSQNASEESKYVQSSAGAPAPGATEFRPSRFQRRTDGNRHIFHFDDVSKYIIPHSALYGRLVICATPRHRIMGFPVELYGRYQRNYFRFNLCFVFDRTADLSCFEPIIRKIGRVLTACEEESGFLSSEDNGSKIYAILEQLYEDLNSYRETSIPIDKFNSIELKLLPFFPNPPPVRDWQVPLALINLKARISSNWDLTIVKVCEFIDGVNHVARIAQLAECDIALARAAISHLRYYQVITMIDIFQFSNIYTLRKSVQWLADQPHVVDEGPSYVGRPGAVLDWPKLLYLYSRLKSGKTVYEWMQEYDVFNEGIDARRFISFGVVKGFLRRVHRWPVLLPSKPSPPQLTAGIGTIDRTGRFGDQRRLSELSGFASQSTLSFSRPDSAERVRSRVQEAVPTITSAGAELVSVAPLNRGAAEKSLAQLRNLSLKSPPAPAIEDKTPTLRTRTLRTPNVSTRESHTSRRSQVDYSTLVTAGSTTTIPTYVSSSPQFSSLRMSPDASGSGGTGTSDGLDSEHSSGGRSTVGGYPARGTHLSKSPSVPTSHLPHTASPFPPSLIPLLDGEHHTDELCTRFNVGWPKLEQWLVMAGGGEGEGDFGNVCIIYR